jgi:hypothetical protein
MSTFSKNMEYIDMIRISSNFIMSFINVILHHYYGYLFVYSPILLYSL